jgi:hypothetical protein
MGWLLLLRFDHNKLHQNLTPIHGFHNLQNLAYNLAKALKVSETLKTVRNTFLNTTLLLIYMTLAITNYENVLGKDNASEGV